MNRTAALTLGIGLGLLRCADGVDPAALWARKVQPLFDVQCAKCHGLIERKSGLELDSPEAVLRGGDEGPVIVPGDPEKSRLFRYLAPEADPHMPPRKQLSDAEREGVREWIAAMGPGPAPAPTSDPAPAGSGSTSREAPGFPSVHEGIDALMAEDWARSGVQPAGGVDERTWCRRVYLDLAGRIPTPQEVEEHLRSPEGGRRVRRVEALLASEEYPVRMRELWDVFLMGRVKRENHEDRRRQNGWWAFLEDGFRTNRPWDRMVRDMLASRPADPASKGASWFLYERRNDHQAIAEAVAPLIYGTRIDCAQCHDHPLAREVKQAHYWGLVAAFNRSKNVEGGAGLTESAVGGFVNFTNLRKESQPAVITLLNGRVVEEIRPAADAKETDSDELYLNPAEKVRVPRFSRREAFAEAATSDNPMLARAFVNRMWAVLLGRGLVHPVDEMTVRNVPSHPELLDGLARDFETHQYDVRRLIRGIVLSRVYALGVAREGGHEGSPAPETFASAIERPLAAEQIARSWRVAAGLPANDDPLRRAVTAAMPDVLPREANATFQQARFLTHSTGLAGLLKPLPGSTAERLSAGGESAVQVREAFLAVLGRVPDSEEAGQGGAFLEDRSERKHEAIRDLLWALMTTSEFLTMP